MFAQNFKLKSIQSMYTSVKADVRANNETSFFILI